MEGEGLGEQPEQLRQSALERRGGIEAEHPVRHVLHSAPGGLDHAPAQHAATGVDAEDARRAEHGTDV
jgi:hypothetical protein